MKSLRFCLVHLVFTLSLLNTAFAEDIPPIWKSTLVGLRGRSVSLVNIDQEKGSVVYEIRYMDTNLTSKVTLDLVTKALLREVFQEKWIITYEYQERSDQVAHLPSKILVYEYIKPGNPGKLLKVYTFQKAIGNGQLRYTDQKGNERIIHCLYFEIVPAR